MEDRAVAFIPVRLNSSRLPRKQLRNIGDRSLLEWIFLRLKDAVELAEVVVATVDESCNQPLREICERHCVPIYWYDGDENHVTTRLVRAAEHFRAEICVLASGDVPLVSGNLVDRLISVLREEPELDLVRVVGSEPNSQPAIQGLSVARLRAWQKADALADRPEFKEHHFPLLYTLRNEFKCMELAVPDDFSLPFSARLSVDTIADLEFLNSVNRELGNLGRPFELSAAVALLKQKPELCRLNSHVHQLAMDHQPRRVLFVIDAGGDYGFGHLTRCGELAAQLTERLGWSTAFVVDQSSVLENLQNDGFQGYWGGFARDLRSPLPNDETVRMEPEWNDYDLVVVDVFDQRAAAAGWRLRAAPTTKVVTIGNRLPWTSEADLRVFPGPRLFGDHWNIGRNEENEAEPVPELATRDLEGMDHFILRRGISRIASNPPPKDWDLLIYLHDSTQRLRAERVLEKLEGVSFEIPGGIVPEFEQMLARARVYVSGFGVSFYEALALRTIPVCWPDSEAHWREALAFFDWLRREPLMVYEASDLRKVAAQAADLAWPNEPLVRDGTPRIVEALFQLVTGRSAERRNTRREADR